MEYDLHGLRTVVMKDAAPGWVVMCTRSNEPFLGIVGVGSDGARFLVDLLPSQGNMPELRMIGELNDVYCLAFSRAYLKPDFGNEFIEPGVAVARIRPGELAIHNNTLLLCFIISREMGRGYLDVRTGELVDPGPSGISLTRIKAWNLYQWESEPSGQHSPILRSFR